MNKPIHKIRTLIVDDEPLARRWLRKLLAEEADFELLGECSDGLEAIARIKQDHPDLVFLDVQMPGTDGFGVLWGLEKEEVPAIIFVTAYDQYAVEAFRLHALDYLLKPFGTERFQEAIEHARQILTPRPNPLAMSPFSPFWRKSRAGRKTSNRLSTQTQYPLPPLSTVSPSRVPAKSVF